MYLAGDGVILDKEKGWNWIEKSAKNGFMTAKVFLAKTYFDATDRDYNKSFFWFKQVVDCDLYNSNTLCLFENMNFKVNFDGDNLNNPFQLDMKILSPDYLARYCDIPNSTTQIDTFNTWSLWYIISNNPCTVSMSQLCIGLLYFTGKGDIKTDYHKSLSYFYKSAKHQNPSAFRNIGIQFDKGVGVEQDYIEANKYYLKAKSLGDIKSLLHIATFYFYGKGVTENHRIALSHLEAYLEHENAAKKDLAYYLIGSIFRIGKEGIKQDYKKALEYLKNAWENGSDVAAYSVAEIYDQGLGVKKNEKNAIDWYLKAVSLNYYPAYYQLGCIELKGYKNREDLDRALEYFRKAEENGITEAQEMIDQITILSFMSLRLSK